MGYGMAEGSLRITIKRMGVRVVRLERERDEARAKLEAVRSLKVHTVGYDKVVLYSALMQAVIGTPAPEEN